MKKPPLLDHLREWWGRISGKPKKPARRKPPTSPWPKVRRLSPTERKIKTAFNPSQPPPQPPPRPPKSSPTGSQPPPRPPSTTAVATTQAPPTGSRGTPGTTPSTPHKPPASPPAPSPMPVGKKVQPPTEQPPSARHESIKSFLTTGGVGLGSVGNLLGQAEFNLPPSIPQIADQPPTPDLHPEPMYGGPSATNIATVMTYWME